MPYASAPATKAVAASPRDRIVCFALFVLFLLAVVGMEAFILGITRPGLGRLAPHLTVLALGVSLSVYYYLYYLLGQWRRIMQLPLLYKAFGLVGGLGLIALTLLMMVLAWIART